MRTILITGAGNGIGRATLMHFHGAGWRVIGLDTDSEALAHRLRLFNADLDERKK